MSDGAAHVVQDRVREPQAAVRGLSSWVGPLTTNLGILKASDFTFVAQVPMGDPLSFQGGIAITPENEGRGPREKSRRAACETDAW